MFFMRTPILQCETFNYPQTQSISGGAQRMLLLRNPTRVGLCDSSFEESWE